MARPKSNASNATTNKLDKTELEWTRVIEREKTHRLATLCLFGTISVGIIAWAAVRITDKPPWLVFALSIVAVLTPPSLLIRSLWIRLKLETRLRDAPERIAQVFGQQTATERKAQDGGNDGS